jgi:hypothetical protein
VIFGEIGIETPRDCNNSFESKIVAKRQTSVGNFGEAVVSLYAGEMTAARSNSMSRNLWRGDFATVRLDPGKPIQTRSSKVSTDVCAMNVSMPTGS